MQFGEQPINGMSNSILCVNIGYVISAQCYRHIQTIISILWRVSDEV